MTDKIPNTVVCEFNTPDNDGYVFKIVETGLGHLCGYLKVPDGHPWLGLSYSDIDCCVHGGLTFKEDNWVGFDCAHAGDSPRQDHPFVVQYAAQFPMLCGSYGGSTYRDIAFVLRELALLYEQARSAARKQSKP